MQRERHRGLIRTRLGEDLREPAREVVAAAERMLRLSNPFNPAEFRGQLPIALSDHVAALLMPALDKFVRTRAPQATLAIAPIPMVVADWLEETGGVLVSPNGTFAATHDGDALVSEAFYNDRYVCVMRRGNPATSRRWNVKTYAEQEHVVVLPRGRTCQSDIDEYLVAQGLTRRVLRLVPSFTLALALVERSDLITTMPERCARQMSIKGVTIRDVPFQLRPLAMKMVVHPAHANDARTLFIKDLLRGTVKS